MSISQEVGRYIPYLRRFSRALTGSRAGGDAYALAALETLVADQNDEIRQNAAAPWRQHKDRSVQASTRYLGGGAD